MLELKILLISLLLLIISIIMLAESLNELLVTIIK